MTARALISGRIWRDPERKVSGAGKRFANATLRVGNGDDTTWWKLLAFNETAIEELLSLKDGDAVSATGEFKVELYDKGGSTRIGFTIFADRVLSAKRQKREKAQERRTEPHQSPISAEAQRPFVDEVPL
jgi:single-stranded DNA-binding protein